MTLRQQQKRKLRYHSAAGASNPLWLTISLRKLQMQRPDLFGIGGLWDWWLGFSEQGRSSKIYIMEHLMVGDSRAAVVIDTSPLTIAAYTDELDCVAMLQFEPHQIASDEMKIGHKLITINTYDPTPGSGRDLFQGHAATGRFANFHPLIADFLTDDVTLLTERKKEISQDEWKRTYQLGVDYRNRHPSLYRPGKAVFSFHSADV